MFHAARCRTKYLILSLLEDFMTYWTFFRIGPVAFCNPTVIDSTCSTSVTPASSINSAINAIFGVFTGGVYLSAMNDLMARHTYSHSVVNIKSRCGIIGKRFDMMGMQQAFFLAAFLTGEIISFVDSLTPFCKIARKPSSFCLGGPAMLVSIGLFACSGFASTGLTTEFLIIIVSLKLAIAKFTFSSADRATCCPAFLGAIFSSVRSVLWGLKFFLAYNTSFRNSSYPMLVSDCIITFLGTIFLIFDIGMKWHLAYLAYFYHFKSSRCHFTTKRKTLCRPRRCCRGNTHRAVKGFVNYYRISWLKNKNALKGFVASTRDIIAQMVYLAIPCTTYYASNL